MPETNDVVTAHRVPTPDGPPPVPSSPGESLGTTNQGASGGTQEKSGAKSNRWIPPGKKITLASLDRKELTVEAQYNPKEIQIDRPIPWQFQKSPLVNRLVLEYSGEDGRSLNLELLFDGYEENESILDEIAKLEKLSRGEVAHPEGFTAVTSYDVKREQEPVRKSEPRFFPSGKPAPPPLKGPGPWAVPDRNPSLMEQLAEAQRPKEEEEPPIEGLKFRAHLCMLTWGEWMANDPLKCVIENISTKYTMFSEDGVPLRAVVSLRLKEAHGVTIARPEDIQTVAGQQQAARNVGGSVSAASAGVLEQKSQPSPNPNQAQTQPKTQ